MSEESLWRRMTRGTTRLRQSSTWERFAGPGWADRILDLDVSDRFHAKQGRTTARAVFTANGETLAVYLKRHYVLPRWLGWLTALWPARNWSPAFQEWDHLQWARAAGLPAPRPVAAGEFLAPWGRLQSFLAVEELADMLSLHEAVPEAAARLDAATFLRWKRGLIAEMARICREMHRRRRFHKDLYLCHFFIPRSELTRPPDNWRGRVFLIDFHRLKRQPLLWFLGQLKDLAQLLYSSEVAGVTDRDRLYFWRVYRGDRSFGVLRRLILFKGRRYRRHNERRRAAELRQRQAA